MNISALHSITSNPVVDFFVTTSKSIQTNALPILQDLIAKVQTTWTLMRPYLEVAAQALSTRMGTGILCLSSAFGFFGHASYVEETRPKITSIVIGTLALLAGTYLLATKALA